MLTSSELRENQMRDEFRSLPAAINAARGQLNPAMIQPSQQACDGAIGRIAPIAEMTDAIGKSFQSLRDRFEILVQRLAPIMSPAGSKDTAEPIVKSEFQESELSCRLRDYEARIRSVERWIIDIIERIEV